MSRNNPFADVELNPRGYFCPCFTCYRCNRVDVVMCGSVVELRAEPHPVAVCICGAGTKLAPAHGPVRMYDR